MFRYVIALSMVWALPNAAQAQYTEYVCPFFYFGDLGNGNHLYAAYHHTGPTCFENSFIYAEFTNPVSLADCHLVYNCGECVTARLYNPCCDEEEEAEMPTPLEESMVGIPTKLPRPENTENKKPDELAYQLPAGDGQSSKELGYSVFRVAKDIDNQRKVTWGYVKIFHFLVTRTSKGEPVAHHVSVGFDCDAPLSNADQIPIFSGTVRSLVLHDKEGKPGNSLRRALLFQNSGMTALVHVQNRDDWIYSERQK